MAGLTTNGRNAIVDGLAAVTTHIGLLDATGTEITGGSPAYARKPVTWTAAASGIRDNNAQLLFDVPAATVAFHGLYSAISAGTNYAILPVQGGSPALPMLATFLAATDIFTSPAHGLSNDQRVVLSDERGNGLAAGFDENTLYFVGASATDTFQLSLTSGGAAIVSAASMECFVQRVVPEVFAAQGQYSIATGALDLDANLI
jgi:hypothetical protein